MKFYCVSCNQPMALTEARGPEDGSMTLLFACPMCERETAMVTNASETRVVRTLGLKLGRADAGSAPRDCDRSRGETQVSSEVPLRGDTHEGEVPEERNRGETGSKCPFSEVVADAYEAKGMVWTSGARVRVDRIPEFARRMAMRSVEEYAMARGYTEISEEVLDEARGRMGF